MYGKLEMFFNSEQEFREACIAPGTKGSRGYTPIGVEKAEGQEVADFKHMLNWGRHLPEGHWLRERYGDAYAANVFPEKLVPGISPLLEEFHQTVEKAQQRILRVMTWHFRIGEEYFRPSHPERDNPGAGNPLPSDAESPARRPRAHLGS